MRKLLALSICAIALFGLMSCQDETTSIVDQLKFSDTPNWSGTAWRGSEDDISIEEYAETVDGQSSLTTTSSICLQEIVYALSLNADGHFQYTISGVYGPNWANDYIPENWNYSTSPSEFIPPDIANGDIDYSEVFINGNFVSLEDLHSTEYTIDQVSTTYNGQTVYPVHFSSTSAAALTAAALVGKAYYEETIDGTYNICALSTNPVNRSSIPYLIPETRTQGEIDYDDAGVALPGDTETAFITPAEVELFNSCFSFTNGLVVNPEGEQVYSILWNTDLSMEGPNVKRARFDSGLVTLYQQN